MAKVVILAGESNTGKSSSIETLPPEETFIINCLNKPLPFRGSANKYNAENRNISSKNTYKQVQELLLHLSKDRPEIKKVVVDDAGFIMAIENMARAMEKGYDKFTEIAQHMYYVLNTAISLRDDLTIVFMLHSKLDELNALNNVYKLDLPGKMIEERFDPQKVCTVVVFTEVEYNDDGTETYNFVVNKTPKFTMAKTPRGMFDTKRIPQDLNLLLDTVSEYYDN
jgi:hypothetical protein